MFTVVEPLPTACPASLPLTHLSCIALPSALVEPLTQRYCIRLSIDLPLQRITQTVDISDGSLEHQTQ